MAEEGRDFTPLSNDAVETGTNYEQLLLYNGILVVIVALLLGALWYGLVYYPEAVVLNGSDAQPLSSEIDFDLMPILPEELSGVYDELGDVQVQQLNSYSVINEEEGRVAIPIDEAIDLVLEEGLPTSESD